MTGGGADHGVKEAQGMLGVFASVGATHFDLSIIGLSGEKLAFRRGVKLADLRRDMPSILAAATSKQRNVIVRPHGVGVSFVQLDDLKGEMLTKIAPAVFLLLHTSPGNFQAWAAIPGGEDKDFARRLRKGAGADATASGATRVAGSLNFKEKYAPKFPRVAIERAELGRLVTAAELDQLGLVAPRESAPTRPGRIHKSGGPRAWPDYDRCLRGAPLRSDCRGPDVSRADFTFALIALDWGWPPDVVAARIMGASPKAKENGETYGARTVENAAAALARRGSAPATTPAGPKQG